MLTREIKLTAFLAVLFATLAFEVQAQTPHDLLWNGKSVEKAMEMLKKDPSWVHKRDSDKRTPLHVAARFGHVEVVKWLLENGADVNAQAYNRFAPLHLTSDPEVVRLILAKGPDLSLKSVTGTPLQRTISDLRNATGERKTQLQKVVDLYLEYDPEIDIVSAIRLNRFDRLKAILKSDPKLAHRHEHTTPIREAANYGAFEICKYLIEKHDVDVNDFDGGTGYPIIKSALKYPNIVKLLIDHGADLDTPISWKGGRSGIWIVGDEATALHFAARDGAPETIGLLLEAGVPYLVNSVELGGQRKKQTAIDVAAIFGRTDNVEALLSHPGYLAKVKKSDGLLDRVLAEAVNPLSGFYARDKKDPVKMVELLILAGADPEAVVNGRTMIQTAASSIHPTEVEENLRLKNVAEQLLQSGAEMDLYSAVALNNLVEIKRILNQDISKVNARRGDGYPALHMATAMNHLDIATELLDHGGDVNIRNHSKRTGTIGATPLHAAAFWDKSAMAEFLLKRGAKVNAIDKNGNTPLHSAVRMGHQAIARLLIEKRADPNARNKKGETPLAWAKNQQMKSLLAPDN